MCIRDRVLLLSCISLVSCFCGWIQKYLPWEIVLVWKPSDDGWLIKFCYTLSAHIVLTSSLPVVENRFYLYCIHSVVVPDCVKIMTKCVEESSLILLSLVDNKLQRWLRTEFTFGSDGGGLHIVSLKYFLVHGFRYNHVWFLTYLLFGCFLWYILYFGNRIYCRFLKRVSSMNTKLKFRLFINVLKFLTMLL